MQSLVICWIIIWGFKDLGDLGDEGGGVAGGVLMMFWIGDFATAILVPGDTCNEGLFSVGWSCWIKMCL